MTEVPDRTIDQLFQNRRQLNWRLPFRYRMIENINNIRNYSVRLGNRHPVGRVSRVSARYPDETRFVERGVTQPTPDVPSRTELNIYKNSPVYGDLHRSHRLRHLICHPKLYLSQGFSCLVKQTPRVFECVFHAKFE